jgi:hypothetical protein
MTMSRDEAQEALRDITKTQQRSSTAYGYSKAAPHFFLWGIIWVLGYGGGYLEPRWNFLFPLLSSLGIVGSFIIGWRIKTQSARMNSGMSWRYWATVVVVLLFVAAFFAIMRPVSGMQVGAFFPILVGLFYSLAGIWTNARRMIVAGLVIGALTLVGYFYLPAYFAIWMAIVGGAALILGGFWLRSI